MKNLWEDLMEDFLEIGCRLSPKEVAFAMGAFRKQPVDSEEIFMVPAFSFGDRIMVIARREFQECLFYFPGEQKIVRQNVESQPVYK